MKKINGKEFLINNALILVVVVMVVFTAFNAKNFFSWGTLNNLLSNVSVRYIIALGVSGILITRGTDLSAGRVVGLSSVVAGGLMQVEGAANDLFPSIGQQHVVVGLLAAIAVAMVFGLLNGLVVSFLHVPAFIATLGMQITVYGLNLLLTKARPIGQFTSTGGETSTFIKIGTQGITFGADGLKIPWLFFFALVVGVVMYILYNKTKHGKYMYAIGGNEIAAEVSGVNTSRTKIIIFTIAAALYGIAGFLISAKTGVTTVNMGQGYELEAIASATIGGVSTSGGVGTAQGVLLGVVVFELLKTALQFNGVDVNMTYVVQGIVIVVAVALDVRKSLVKK